MKLAKLVQFNLLIVVVMLALPGSMNSVAASKVKLLRAPNNGLQPQAVMDERGGLNLIYLTGDPAASDVFYVRRAPGKEFTTPMRVNSQPGSAIAIGTIRGAQIALGKNGRVHVAWNGSNSATPRSQNNSSPMLYARMNEAGNGFEPQRNLMQSTQSLDGGGSVAADKLGNVYVVWHAMGAEKGEQYRRVWLATSADDGKTFAREAAVDSGTGACGCCGMRAFVDARGSLSLLYRTATDMTERGMFLLTSTDKGQTFSGRRLDNWNLTSCPMSSETMTANANHNLAAWENDGQVFFAALSRNGTGSDGRLVKVAAPDATGKRKHPAMAVNSNGETLLVWTEGTGWKKGGSLAWQIFDRDGKPTTEKGIAPDVPVWGLATVITEADGSFTIIY